MRKYSAILASVLFLLAAQASFALGQVSPLFRQCEDRIREAHKNNVISYAEQQNLLTRVHQLQARQEYYVPPQQPRPYKGRVAVLTNYSDPVVMRELNAINAKLLLQPMSLAKGPGTASAVPPKPWPPRDAAGHILKGPKTSGTREEIGWPNYGWSNQDRANYYRTQK